MPGDDWDSDYTHERTLVRTRVSPDPKYVKWINPTVRAGQEHDVVVAIGEAGGIFMLDRNDGKFLWATPFPADDPKFVISDIDVKTGKTSINWDNVFKKPGDRPHHLLLEHAQLLAHGVQPRNELALHVVYRQLPRPYCRWSRSARRSN